MRPGRLVLVVGPSGAGKDTLIAGARAELAGDPLFVFPERLITRTALPEAEAHGTLSRAEFDRRVETGDFALAWEAHGLGYVIPRSVTDAVAFGHVAVCNGSRRIVADAVARFPETRVILVDAQPAVRARRLAARGRETAAEIEGRLAREVPDPAGDVPVTRVDNSGALEAGVTAFVNALLSLADAPMNERKDR